VQYPNLYPASFKHSQAQRNPALPVYPIPRTAQSCKRFPGFAGDGGDDPPHGVRDSLFDWATFELGGKTHEALKPLLENRTCPRSGCHKAMHHFPGFYRRLGDGRGRAEMGVKTRLQTHTGINRETGTVQEGILYSREVFEERARFSGVVKLPDELADTFEKFIAQVGETGLVRVGNGRTRGLGKVALATNSAEHFELEAFKTRLSGFNEKLKGHVLDTLKGQELAPFYFALTLHAPAILLDPLLRYRGSIDEATLGGLLGLRGEPFRRIYQNTDVRQVTGWNELWCTPRMSEYAIEHGSVFLFTLDREADDALFRALFRLEEEGIGQRRGEGFGRVCISDPFHSDLFGGQQ